MVIEVEMVSIRPTRGHDEALESSKVHCYRTYNTV